LPHVGARLLAALSNCPVALASNIILVRFSGEIPESLETILFAATARFPRFLRRVGVAVSSWYRVAMSDSAFNRSIAWLWAAATSESVPFSAATCRIISPLSARVSGVCRAVHMALTSAVAGGWVGAFVLLLETVGLGFGFGVVVGVGVDAGVGVGSGPAATELGGAVVGPAPAAGSGLSPQPPRAKTAATGRAIETASFRNTDGRSLLWITQGVWIIRVRDVSRSRMV